MDSLTPLLKKDINEKAQALLDDDQKHIFEAVGFIAYSVHSDPPLHQSIIDVATTELLKAMKTILQNELYKMDIQENPQYSLYLSRSIHSIASFSKPFKTCTKEISPYFQSAMDLVIEAWVKITQFNVDLRSEIMFFFHRMVECLDKAIIPALPNLINVLFTTPCSPSELLNSIRLLNQLISRFKGELKGLIEKILSPLTNRLFDLLAKTDDLADKREIHRLFLQFIQNVVTFKLSSTLISDENKGNLMFILNMILESCRVEPNGNLKNLKACVVLLGDITSEWTGKVQGYDQYFLTSVLPMFIFVLSKLNFRDAESLSIATSICAIQRKYSKSMGPPFLEHLATILNKLGNPEFTNSYLFHITNDPNDKSFLSSISGLFSNLSLNK